MVTANRLLCQKVNSWVSVIKLVTYVVFMFKKTQYIKWELFVYCVHTKRIKNMHLSEDYLGLLHQSWVMYAKEDMTVTSKICLFPGGSFRNWKITVILRVRLHLKQYHFIYTNRKTEILGFLRNIKIRSGKQIQSWTDIFFRNHLCCLLSLEWTALS